LTENSNSLGRQKTRPEHFGRVDRGEVDASGMRDVMEGDINGGGKC